MQINVEKLLDLCMWKLYHYIVIKIIGENYEEKIVDFDFNSCFDIVYVNGYVGRM